MSLHLEKKNREKYHIFFRNIFLVVVLIKYNPLGYFLCGDILCNYIRPIENSIHVCNFRRI